MGCALGIAADFRPCGSSRVSFVVLTIVALKKWKCDEVLLDSRYGFGHKIELEHLGDMMSCDRSGEIISEVQELALFHQVEIGS